MKNAIHHLCFAAELAALTAAVLLPIFSRVSTLSFWRWGSKDVEVRFRFADGQDRLLDLVCESYLYYQTSEAGHFPEKQFLTHESKHFEPNVWYSYSVPMPITRIRLDFRFKKDIPDAKRKLAFSNLEINGRQVYDWELERPDYDRSPFSFYVYPSKVSFYGCWRIYCGCVGGIWLVAMTIWFLLVGKLKMDRR